MYDKWQVLRLLGYPNNSSLINSYGSNLTSSFKQKVLSNIDNGCFLNSCEYHCFHWDVIHIDNTSMGNAFYDWYYGIQNSKNNQWMQLETFPCQDCCS